MKLIRENLAVFIALVCLVAVTLALQVTFVVRFEQLHSNICTAVAQSGRGNTALYSYWTGASARARARSVDDKGPGLKAADRQAADQDDHIAAVFAPHPGVSFPGC